MVSHGESDFFYKDLLRFYEETGVDTALCETPINRFSCSERKKHTQALLTATEVRSTKLSETAIQPYHLQSTNLTPGDAQTLDELKAQLESFDDCQLKFTAKNTCFSDGTPGSALMLIGEAPGRDEDIQGRPFVGRSGQLLNRILNAIGLERNQVYIANTIPWRPPGNRTPTPMEVELCRPFIDRQIELARPKILMALGGPAAKLLIGSKEGILRLRGNWHVYRTTLERREIPVMPTLHPAYLLRSPSQKKFAWNDFLIVKMLLKELGDL
ncbi:MAG: Uracil-DNA glycosylase [Candidatus Tokpelaia sp. JSC188]|nr:MAG: Uracil-DNA glycosylase [Candidatus Tokpelaia sp. JSC188]